MNTNEAKKALLRENKYALRGLHDVFGFDFEKPHDIIFLRGTFTVGKVKKIAASAGYADKSEIVLLLKAEKGYWTDELHVAKLIGDSVKIGFNAPWYHGKSLKTSDRAFDTFYAKKSFEELRKNENVVVYIVCQKRDFLRLKEKEYIDREDRYTFDCRWTGHYNITSCTTNKVYELSLDSYRKERIEDVFDRSGYFVKYKRDDLKRRAAKLRAEREKAAYAETDNSEKISTLLALIGKRQAELVNRLSAATTSEALRAVEKSISYFSGFAGIVADFETFQRKTINKEYPSITASENAYNRLLERLSV